MTIQRFEELFAWQAARRLVKAVCATSRNRDVPWDVALRDQIRRAALSIMANIAEGFHRRSDREFVQFLFIAKASLAEVQSHLYAAVDQGYLNDSEFRHLFDQTEKIAKQVSGFISYLNK